MENRSVSLIHHNRLRKLECCYHCQAFSDLIKLGNYEFYGGEVLTSFVLSADASFFYVDLGAGHVW